MSKLRITFLICLALHCVLFQGTAQDPPIPNQPQNKVERDTEIQAKRIALIRFEADFSPMSERFLFRKLDVIEEDNFDLIVLEIDSPGGRLDVMDRMIDRVRQLKPKHVVAYVPRQALSAGAIFSLVCDEIVIEKDALFGDAGPIIMNEGFMFEHAPEKFRSHLVEQVRGLANERNRPPALAEAMVDMDLEVFEVTSKKDGSIHYMSKSEMSSSDDPDNWENPRLVHESRTEHFLEVTGVRAVELGLADAIVKNREDLRNHFGAEELVVFERTTVDTAVLILNHPVMTGVVFIVGLIALFIEFSSPGIGVGGLTACICFALFFWSRFLGGTAEWLEVIMFIAGLSLMGIEIFVIPGFGIWGLSGLLLMGTSLVMASQDFLIPRDGAQWSSMIGSTSVVLVSLLIFVVAAVIFASRLGSVPGLNRLMLKPPAIGANAESEVPNEDIFEQHGQIIQVGDRGIADSLLRPAGKAKFADQFIDVISDGNLIESGTTIRVVKIQGNAVFVRAV